ncbi:MAG: beta strand repeat-containing protein, partial [Terracidiphilus sp.]
MLILLVCSLVLSGCTSNVASIASSNPSVTGTLTASSASVTFGSVQIGQSASTIITVTNEGSAPVLVSQMTVSGSSFQATSQSELPASISPSSSFTFTITFAPTGTGPATGQLNITSNATNANTVQVGLSGTGAAASVATSLTSLGCTNNSVTGSTADNCTVELSAPAGDSGQVVNLASNSSAVTVPATVTVAAGATSANFAATASAVTTPQTVTLTAFAGNVTEDFSMQLNAVTAALTLSAGTLNFGNVDVSSSATQTLALMSTGTAPVTVSGLTVTGTGYTAPGASFPMTLNPGQTANIGVEFDPVATGTTIGQLSLSSNSSDGAARNVVLSGIGIPIVSGLSCATGQITGAGSDLCSVTLNAAAATGGFVVNLASNNAAVTVPASVTVAAGLSNATFSLTTTGSTTPQTVTITASAGNLSRTFALELGTSVATLNLSQTTIAFGTVQVNKAMAQTVTLSSTGTAPVTVSGASVAGSGFSISGESFPLTINPNGTATLAVQFDPTASGAATGTVTVSSDSSTGTAQTINLSGTGTPVLSGLSCANGSMTGAGADNCTVTLNAAA